MPIYEWVMWVCAPVAIILSALSYRPTWTWSHRASDAAAVMFMVGAVLLAVDSQWVLSGVWLVFTITQALTSVMIRKWQRVDAEIIALQTEIEAMRHEH